MTTQRSVPSSASRPIPWGKVLRRVGFYVMLVALMAPFALPFVWMVLNSIKSQKDMLAIPPTLSFTPSLENFRMVLGDPRWPLYLKNSTYVAFASTLLALLLGLPSAFAIARYRQSRLANAILMARILPHVSVLVPWYVAFSLLNLGDTYLALTVTHMVLALPLSVWIMIPFYEGLSPELLDAAYVDGCSLRGAFLRIAVPLSLPGIAVAFILAFTGSWNQFMLSVVVSGPRTMTLPVLAYGQIAFDRIYYGAMAASAVALTAPVLLLTLFAQRYLIKGLALGSR